MIESLRHRYWGLCVHAKKDRGGGMQFPYYWVGVQLMTRQRAALREIAVIHVGWEGEEDAGAHSLDDC